MESRYRPNQAERRQTPPRRRRSRGFRTLLFTGILVGVFTVALVVYLMFFRDRERTISMTQTPISSGMTHLNTGRGLLYQTDGAIHYYDWIDEKRNYTYGTAADDIRMTGNTTMSAVYNRNSLQVVGKTSPMTFTGTIETVECGIKHLAVLRKDSDGQESVLIMTEDGEQIDQILPGNTFIVDFGFYNVNGERFWIELLSITASEPTVTIRTYELAKKSQTGAIQVQSQLVEDVYITDSSIFVAGTNQIIRYTHGGNQETSRFTIYGYTVLDFSASPTFLLTPRGGDMHSVKLLRITEADNTVTETYLQLPSEGVAGFLMNNSLIVVSREKMFTYKLDGSLSETAALEFPIENAYKLSDTMLLLESGGQFYTASVK